MQGNGAFDGFRGGDPVTHEGEALRWLAAQAGPLTGTLAASFRRGDTPGMRASTDWYALLGWSLQVLAQAGKRSLEAAFSQDALTPELARALVALSALDDGPRQAQLRLAQIGIALEIVPHLRRTYLDGAVFLGEGERPVIGLTLRYNRLDNFWFVLMHEIGHLACGHFSQKQKWIADDLDLPPGGSSQEAEANEYAARSLLPPDFDLHLHDRLTARDICSYAASKAVHPAIVAGRVRHERKDFRTFTQLIGRGKVRGMFPVRKWGQGQ
jgi:HTH-type transcriptional regulator/antitoxin HigA